MKKISAILLACLWTASYGAEEKERIYLTQILNQLDAIKPLILAAQKEQPATNRIKFHYVGYRDYQGKQHSGLLEDINAIYSGIREKLDHAPVEGRIFVPIHGDYLNQQLKASA